MKIRYVTNFLDRKIGLGGAHFKLWHFIFLILAISTILFIYSDPWQPESIRKLQEKEVREYEGQNLSSIADLKETSISGTQYIDIKDYKLEITGLVNTPKAYTYQEVLNFPKYSKVVELNCVTGWRAKILWEGFLIKDILEEASVKPESKAVIFYASDGFTTSLPLDFLIDNDIILAYKINDVVLPPERGFPFQLVSENKWGYKWIKWLTKIELSDDIDYKGTYKGVGYSHDADITGPKLER
ncbi:MAG: oxidoreductase [Parcubacteria group bacterium]|nr:oxidoreductase [Parcubacteria group bacterium]|tara:strand:- start:17424 stop:18149 length:726 start_codon:yes stop_codon:yes gene_type:complete